MRMCARKDLSARARSFYRGPEPALVEMRCGGMRYLLTTDEARRLSGELAAAVDEVDVLKGYLEAAGIEPVMVTAADYPLACEMFLDGITDARITHSGQSILTESALSGMRRPMTNGRFTWDGAPGAAPLCHLVAATLAYWGAATAAPPKRKAPLPMADTPDQRPEDDWLTRPF